MLYSLVKAHIKAEQGGMHLGDVRPRNIFINQDARVKVATSLSWPLEVSNIQKMMEKNAAYVAPEDLQKIGANNVF